jgi:type I restriction enzyme, S subunit
MSWKEIELSALLEFSPKISLEKGELYDHIPMEAIDSGTKYPREIYQKEYTGGGTKFANGDTLFARITPCLENGKIAKVKDLEKQVGFGSTEYFVLRAKENISDSDFVYYLAKTDLVRQTAIKSMSGADGRQRADKGAVEQLKVFNIPLPTQRRIASILSAYDDLIENNLKRIKLLEEKAFLRYKQIVKEEKVEKHILSEFGDIITGKTPSTVIADNFGDDVLFIKTPDMHNQIFVEHTDQMLSELGAKSQEKKFLPPLSLCVSCIGTAGVVGITSKPSQTNQQINSIVFYEQKNVYFFYALMSQMKEQLDALGSNGSTFTNVNKNKFENMEVSVPNQKVLEEFAQEFESPFNLILTLQKQNTKLREARDILLPKLMSGQIVV